MQTLLKYKEKERASESVDTNEEELGRVVKRVRERHRHWENEIQTDREYTYIK